MMLFCELLAAWKQDHFQDIQHGTQVSYNPPMKLALSEFGNLQVSKITPLMIDQSVRAYARKGYSHGTVKIYLSLLRQVFRFSVLMGELQVNPVTEVRLPKNLPSGVRELPSDQQMKQVVSCVNLPFGFFAFFLMFSGLRRGEALALQWSDIDFCENCIHVRRSVYFVGDKPHFKYPKTIAGIRDVYLLKRLRVQLSSRVGKPNHYVFGGKNLLTLDHFNRLWNHYAVAAGFAYPEKRHVVYSSQEYDKTYYVQTLTPHQLRHAFATLLFEAGVNEKDAQIQMGHSSIDITRNIYTHVRDSRRESTVSLLNNFIEEFF